MDVTAAFPGEGFIVRQTGSAVNDFREKVPAVMTGCSFPLALKNIQKEIVSYTGDLVTTRALAVMEADVDITWGDELHADDYTDLIVVGIQTFSGAVTKVVDLK